MRLLHTLLLLGFAAPLAAQDAAPTATSIPDLEQIMADPEWIGAQVEQPFWAWDGQHVHFRLERSGSALRDLYRFDFEAGRAIQTQDAALEDLDAPEPVYDAGRQRMLFVRNGDLFVRTLSDGTLDQLTRGMDGVSDPMFLVDGGIAFRSGQRWYRADAETVGLLAEAKAEKDPSAKPDEDLLRDMQLRLFSTLARERDQREAEREQAQARRRADATRAPEPLYLGDKLEIAGSSLSPNARWLLVVTTDKGHERGRIGKMPKYVTESGYEEVEDVRVRVGRNPPAGHQLVLFDLSDGSRHDLALDALPGIDADPLAGLREAAGKPALDGLRKLRIDGVQWSDDGSHVAILARATDNKDRWIAGIDFEDPALTTWHRLTDEAWINWNFNQFAFLPGGDTLWLLSEQSGHSQLYTVAPGGKPRALTRGEFELSEVQLRPDGGFLALCNRNWPGDYEVCAIDRDGEVRELTSLDGVESFAISPAGDRLLLGYSGSYLPRQLAVVDIDGSGQRVLTDTRTPEFRAIEWQQPEIVEVPSSHVDAPIWTKFYKPNNMQPGKRYPIVIFVHGAGYTQNTHLRYPYYFREQMFHNLLAERGYLVIDMDYRASEGYGRDWRTAIYRQMGHPELEDLLDGIDWAVENHQGDRERVGVYGGSYGGFMAFMALFRAPEAFVAGAALRPVTDWAMYNHEYTSNILNTPDIDPEAYARSSPIEHAENFRGHLLIAHGMIDDNVLYQDSVRLAQRLIELGKENWELASYPLERHSFVHHEAWLDEYRRVLKLFETTLRD